VEDGNVSQGKINQPHSPLALRINDAAAVVGVSRSTLYKLIGAKKLPTLKVAGRRLILVSALQALLAESHDQGPT
jgi:excisionase family DNA binding protein